MRAEQENRKYTEKNETGKPGVRERVMEFFLIVLMLAAFCAALTAIVKGSVERPVASLESLTEGWYYVEDGVRTEVTLPAKIVCADGTLELLHDGIGELYAGQTLTMRGAQYQLEILLGDEVLYAYEDSELFPRNKQMKAKLDCDALLPAEGGADTLKLRFQSENGVFYISGVRVGDGQTVANAHFWSAAGMLAADVMMIVLGVIAAGIEIYLYTQKMNDGRFLDLAVFFVICAVWRLTDSSLVQNGTACPEIVCVVSFYMFMLLAPPMLHFLQKIGSMKKYRLLDVGIFAFYLNAAVQGFLNYLGLFSFIQMLFVTHLLLAAGVFLSVWLLMRERKEHPDWETTLVLWAFLLLGVSGVLALLFYWIGQVPYYGAIFEVGILLFIGLLLAEAVVKMVQNIRSVTELRVYLRLQQEDWMTGLKNRRLFEERLNAIQTDPDPVDDALLIFLDINHLREINEEFGRTVGDSLVVAAARCIERAFGGDGACYRIGGDEFAVLLFGSGLDRQLLSDRLRREVESFNLGSHYKLSMAIGASSLRDRDGYLKRVSDWKYEADAELFHDKERNAYRREEHV